MSFFDIFWPCFTALWAVLGILTIGPGISLVESVPWGSEKIGGPLTRLGYVLVSVCFLVVGPFYLVSILREGKSQSGVV